MQYSHLSDTVNLKKVKESENLGVFHIEGLYAGYGVTFGNSLRRVLLSSLPGAAITKVKIKGADHEFSTLPGMVEDIIQLSLNLKKVRLSFLADEPQVLNLHVKGECEVKAADIQSNAFVQVINSELHLATLTKKNAEIDMELTVEKGLGYIASELQNLERLPIGTILLDAIFSPVLRVEFSVENMRVGDRTDYNRLKIEVETDGSISPSDALHKAGNILKDHFEKISNVEIQRFNKGEVEKNEAPVEKKIRKRKK